MAVKFPTVTCSEKLALILGAGYFHPQIRTTYCIPIQVVAEDGREKMLWWRYIFDNVNSVTSKGKILTS